MHRATRRTVSRAIAGLVLGLGSVATAHAQGYPANPIQLVMPYPVGGSLDATARILAGC